MLTIMESPTLTREHGLEDTVNSFQFFALPVEAKLTNDFCVDHVPQNTQFMIDENSEMVKNRSIRHSKTYFTPRIFSTEPWLTNELSVDSALQKVQLLIDWNSQMKKYKDRRQFNTDCSPEIFTSDKNVLNVWKIGQKIREMAEDRHFKTVIGTTFSEVSFLLDSENIEYEVVADIEEDMENTEWKEAVVSIRLSNVNTEKAFQMWELIENKVQNSINQLNDEIVKEKFKNLVLIVETPKNE